MGRVSTLPAVARLIREDLVLLRQRGDDPAVLCAACVCFSFGQLRAKLGSPLAGVHAPVPGYARSLGRPLDRIFAGLKPSKGLWRHNFEFRWTGELLHPSATGDPLAKGDLTHLSEPTSAATEAAPARSPRGPRDMHLRVEYQTISRLPRSDHILFTIRSYIDPLPRVAAHLPSAAVLASRVEALGDAFAEYKGVTREMRPRLVAYLRAGGVDAGD